MSHPHKNVYLVRKHGKQAEIAYGLTNANEAALRMVGLSLSTIKSTTRRNGGYKAIYERQGVTVELIRKHERKPGAGGRAAGRSSDKNGNVLGLSLYTMPHYSQCPLSAEWLHRFHESEGVPGQSTSLDALNEGLWFKSNSKRRELGILP